METKEKNSCATRLGTQRGATVAPGGRGDSLRTGPGARPKIKYRPQYPPLGPAANKEAWELTNLMDDNQVCLLR